MSDSAEQGMRSSYSRISTCRTCMHIHCCSNAEAPMKLLSQTLHLGCNTLPCQHLGKVPPDPEQRCI